MRAAVAAAPAAGQMTRRRGLRLMEQVGALEPHRGTRDSMLTVPEFGIETTAARVLAGAGLG